jgi:hypothetical protein
MTFLFSINFFHCTTSACPRTSPGRRARPVRRVPPPSPVLQPHPIISAQAESDYVFSREVANISTSSTSPPTPNAELKPSSRIPNSKYRVQVVDRVSTAILAPLHRQYLPSSPPYDHLLFDILERGQLADGTILGCDMFGPNPRTRWALPRSSGEGPPVVRVLKGAPSTFLRPISVFPFAVSRGSCKNRPCY